MKIGCFAVATLGIGFLLGACSHNLSPEEKKEVDALQAQAAELKKDIATAEVDDARYSGGLLKALTQVRLQVIKTNNALIQQRILAIQSRSPVTVQTYTTTPDSDTAQKLQTEIAEEQKKLAQTQAEAATAGGLIQAMTLSTAATQAQTIAMLQQRYLIAKYGLAMPKMEASGAAVPSFAPTAVSSAPPPKPSDEKPEVQDNIITVTLQSKERKEQDYQDYVFFNCKYQAIGLDKPARAIKGVLHLNDLFGERKFNMRLSIDKAISPGESVEEKGTGFKYNRFEDSHQWVGSAKLEDMKATFTVTNILYQDGTRRDF